MDNFKPSYETYKKIISDIKETGKYCDYSNAIDKDEFILMRHDIEFSIDRFSIHRPIKEVYYHKIQIPGIYNAYAPEFFSYADEITDYTKLDVKYIADSKHHWNYGIPLGKDLTENKKIQILIHPFSWTEEGYDNFNNFKSLLNEKDDELITTLNDEFKRFSEIHNEIKNEQCYFHIDK